MEYWMFRPLPDSTETLSWVTDVMLSPFSEMRVSLRPARQALTYAYNLRDVQNVGAEDLIRDNFAGDWLVPVWHEASVAKNVLATDDTLSVSTAADYQPGRQAVVWGGCTNYSVMTIDAVGTGSVTFTEPVGVAYAAAYVMPVVTAYLGDGGFQSARIRERGVSNATITFVSRELPPEGVSPFDQSEDGYDLVSKCGTLEPLQASYVPPVAYIDNALGPVALEPLRALVTGRYSMFWRMKPQKLWERRLWLHTLRGRDKPFILTDWQDDGRTRLVRLDTDVVEFAHRRGFVSEARLPLMEVWA